MQMIAERTAASLSRIEDTLGNIGEEQKRRERNKKWLSVHPSQARAIAALKGSNRHRMEFT